MPYGYRKTGEKATARLVVAEEPIPGLDLSEADVVRMIYKMAAVERTSCYQIAARLNELRVPCAYRRDDRMVLRGKRKQRTSGLWRPGRVRNLIVSTTYKGVHEYGKRSRTKGRVTIPRPVPAIVDEKTWTKARENLTAHFLFGARNTRNHYLLRGLMKCACCNLTYIGVANIRPSGKREFYYRCNGNQGARGFSARTANAAPPRRSGARRSKRWSGATFWSSCASPASSSNACKRGCETTRTTPARTGTGSAVYECSWKARPKSAARWSACTEGAG